MLLFLFVFKKTLRFHTFSKPVFFVCFLIIYLFLLLNSVWGYRSSIESRNIVNFIVHVTPTIFFFKV